MAFAAVNTADTGEVLNGETKMSPKPRYKSYRWSDSLRFACTFPDAVQKKI